jgi:hypothetical protein
MTMSDWQFICDDCDFQGDHYAHTKHVVETGHWTYRNISKGKTIWTRSSGVGEGPAEDPHSHKTAG